MLCAHSGSSPENVPGYPEKIEKDGTTVPWGRKVLSAIAEQSLRIQCLPITQFLPIYTKDPIDAAFTILSFPINTWSPMVIGKKATLYLLKK